MYCKQCGHPLTPGAVVCMNCGFAAGTGANYCAGCGAPTAPGQAICTNCGLPLVPPEPPVDPAKQKSKLTAGLLGLFLGSLGLHNFYLGYKRKGAMQLVLAIVGAILQNLFAEYYVYGTILPAFGMSLGGGMSVSSLISLFGSVIVFGVRIWTIVEGVQILTGKIKTDASGTALK